MKKLKGKTVSNQEIEVDYLGAKSSFKAKTMPKPLDPKGMNFKKKHYEIEGDFEDCNTASTLKTLAKIMSLS